MLTPAELESLNLHLETCAQCRNAFAEYQHLATVAIPSLADRFASNPGVDAFDESSAAERLMRSAAIAESQPVCFAVAPSETRIWNQGWAQSLAAAFLLLAVGAGVYFKEARPAAPRVPNVIATSQPALARDLEEKQQLAKTLEEERRTILVLEQQAKANENDLARFRAQVKESSERTAQLQAALADANGKLSATAQERDANAIRVHAAEKMYQDVQDELHTLQNQHQQDLLRAASLETRVNSLNADLTDDQMKRTKTDGQFLAMDKDIRDLIGARNLYIADIMDVNEQGQSKKPFGRVFYTKTKSLIFYAYDLDQQPGLKLARTFQVWGRTSASDRKPVNLGILYMDSATNQRWTLRVDNPERIANLEAVFVTIEPHEQTDKPTGKPFLYASLRREANHP
jgi:hypothetical protein